MFSYDDIKGKEKDLQYIPGYEIGMPIPVLLSEEYDGQGEMCLTVAALRLGYYMGMEAQKHAGEQQPGTDPEQDADK